MVLCLVLSMILISLIDRLTRRNRGRDSRWSQNAGTPIVNRATSHNNLLAMLRWRNNFWVHGSLILSIKMSPMHLSYKWVSIPTRYLLIVRFIFDGHVLINTESGLLIQILFVTTRVPAWVLIELAMVLHLSKYLPLVGLFDILFLPLLSLVHFAEMGYLLLKLRYLSFFLPLLF